MDPHTLFKGIHQSPGFHQAPTLKDLTMSRGCCGLETKPSMPATPTEVCCPIWCPWLSIYCEMCACGISNLVILTAIAPFYCMTTSHCVYPSLVDEEIGMIPLVETMALIFMIACVKPDVGKSLN